MSRGTGFLFTARKTTIVIGAISNIVVTLSSLQIDVGRMELPLAAGVAHRVGPFAEDRNDEKEHL